MIEDKTSDWRRFAPLRLTPVLQHALDAFYAHGYHGASMRSIAQRNGVAVPTLYHYHQSKEAVLVALLDEAAHEVIERVTTAKNEGGDDVSAQFANVIEAFVLFTTHRVKLAFLDLELRLAQADAQTYTAARRKLHGLLADIVHEGVSTGLFVTHQPNETVRALLGMCRAIAHWYQIDGELTPSDVAQRYVHLALNAVGTRTPSRKRITT